EPFGDHIEHGTIGRERHILNESGNPRRGLIPDTAGIGCELATNDLQQCGLARAVATDDGNPFARVHLERHIVQQRQVTVRDRNVIELNQWHLIRGYLIAVRVRWERKQTAFSRASSKGAKRRRFMRRLLQSPKFTGVLVVFWMLIPSVAQAATK